MAIDTSSVWGRIFSSKNQLNGTGESFAATRRTGPSSNSKNRSAIRAEISAQARLSNYPHKQLRPYLFFQEKPQSYPSLGDLKYEDQ